MSKIRLHVNGRTYHVTPEDVFSSDGKLTTMEDFVADFYSHYPRAPRFLRRLPKLVRSELSHVYHL